MRVIQHTAPLVRCEGGLCSNRTRSDRAIRQADGTYRVLCDPCLTSSRG